MSPTPAFDCTTLVDPNLISYCTQTLADNDALVATLDQAKFDNNQFFIIWASSLVLFMHAGFAMLSAGAIRGKNSKNILLSIVMDLSACAVAFYILGFGFAYGNDVGGFIGSTKFGGDGYEADFSNWLFQYCFAATGATIVSGAIAERARFETYLATSFYMSVWVYPVVVHWVWGGGFLTLGKPYSVLATGAIDFAGCGPVHMVGGVAGFVGAIIMGPRVGRFDAITGQAVPMPGHSAPLATLGTFILWVGWLGFNGGSALYISNGSGAIASRACVNTIMSSAGGALGAMFFNYIFSRDWDLTACLNGALAGLVSITGCCFCVEMWAALVIGVIGGIIYVLSSKLVLNVFRVDDPLDATAVHMFCGMWGILAGAFFANPLVIDGLFSPDSSVAGSVSYTPSGIIYGAQTYMAYYADGTTVEGGGGPGGSLVATAVVEIVCVFFWVVLCTVPWFLFWHKLGLLRISADVEEAGIDASAHGGSAYPESYYPSAKSPTGKVEDSSAAKNMDEIAVAAYEGKA